MTEQTFPEEMTTDEKVAYLKDLYAKAAANMEQAMRNVFGGEKVDDLMSRQGGSTYS